MGAATAGRFAPAPGAAPRTRMLAAQTAMEFRLLRMLMLNPTRVSPNWLLERALGGEGHNGRKVQFYVARLRRKLGDRHRVLIRTAHGAGYRLAGRTAPSA